MHASVLSPRARLPLTVIGGFLGAGKTTLLNRLLQQSRGRRHAVLVNDFGSINVDAALIAEKSGDAIALTNGCACCSIGGDLTAALIRVLEAPLPFDEIFIEASGVSDPWKIAQVALADSALGLNGVIVLVDASACLLHAADPLLADSLERQLRSADIIVVNKIDQVEAAERERVHQWLATFTNRTPCFEATHADVPIELISGGALSEIDDRDEPSGAHDHANGFSTWSGRPERVFPASELRAFLRDMPTGVLRLKGFIRTDEHGWAELQFSGRHGSLRRAITEPATGPAVVAIGLTDQLPRQLLEAVFGVAA